MLYYARYAIVLNSIEVHNPYNNYKAQFTTVYCSVLQCTIVYRCSVKGTINMEIIMLHLSL